VRHVARLPGYVVEAVLGRGGFGSVVRARGALGIVAIKIAHAGREARERLTREHGALAAVGPPLVPALLGRGTSDDGSPFLVMELIDGPTLRARITAGGGDLAAVAGPLAVAIAALHARGFVHRDLKPDNAFVLPDRVVLVDLGLARPVDLELARPVDLGLAHALDLGLAHALDAGELTGTGAAIGTALYAAPEQLAGAIATPASDVYSLGVMLYELATGRPPFIGSDALVRVAHHSHRPVPPRQLAPIDLVLEAIVLDCLAKDPADRPSAAAVAERVEHAGGAGNVTSPVGPPVGRSRAACSVVLLEAAGASAAATAIAEVVAGQRGELAGIVDGCWAAVFSAIDAARPDLRAAQAARALVDAGFATRALVERREVTVRTRGNGTRQVLSNLHDRARERLAEIARGSVAITGDGESDAAAPRHAPEPASVQAPSAPGPSTPGPSESGITAPQPSEPGPSMPGMTEPGPGTPGPSESAMTAPQPTEPGFVGRSTILAALVAEGRAAAGSVTVVVGEDGAGRTRLAHRLGAELRALGGRVVVVDLRDATAGGVQSALPAIARELAAIELPANGDRGDGAALERALGLPAEAVARLRATPGAYRGAIARGLAAAIVRAASAAPLAAVIDDAQLADLATLDALRIASETPGARLALYLMSRRPLWGGAPTLALPRLEAGEAAGLCRELVRPAIDVPDAAIIRMTELADGNPRRLVALCRSLHAIGAIRARARGGDHYLDTGALDDTLRAAARGDWAELAAIDPVLRDCAGALALLAPGFAAADAVAILAQLPCDRFPLDPGVALDRLRRRGLVEGEHALRLPGANAAAALVAALGPEAARRVHAAAAAHYRERLAGSGNPRAWLPRLVPHVAALGDGDRAAELLVALAGHARDDHDYLAAEAWYGRALELVHDLGLELEARRGRAVMRHRLGRYEDAIADTERGRELARAARDGELEAELLFDEATALDWVGEVQRSAARLDQARALVGDAPRPRLYVRLLLAEGRTAWRTTTDLAVAVAWLERAIAAAAPLGDEVYEDRIAALAMLVFLLPRLDRLDDAERLADEALAICEHRGDRHHQMAVLNNRQTVSLRRGLVDRAIADLEHAERLGRELGMPLVRYATRLSLADLHRRIGDPAAARRHAELARLAETAGSAAGSRQSAAIMLVQVLAMLDELAAARGLLAEIRAADLMEEEAVILRAVTLALADADDDAGWQDLLGDLATAPGLLPDLLEQRALAARRRGELPAARRHLTAALDAARLHDPAARGRLERALQAVP